MLLHLLLQYKPDIHVIYGNTTIEFPECVRFARWLRDEWHLNYHEARPDVTFWWVVKEYGWPILGKDFGVGGVAHKTSREQFFDDLAARGELTANTLFRLRYPFRRRAARFSRSVHRRRYKKRWE